MICWDHGYDRMNPNPRVIILLTDQTCEEALACLITHFPLGRFFSKNNQFKTFPLGNDITSESDSWNTKV